MTTSVQSRLSDYASASGTAAVWVVSALPDTAAWAPYFSLCEINVVGVRNVELKQAISTDPNPNPKLSLLISSKKV